MRLHLRFESLPLRWPCAWVGLLISSASLFAAEPFLPPSPVATPSAAADNSAGFIDFGGGPLPLQAYSPAVPQQADATAIEKPAYAVLAAQLANWDADSEPDGWRCSVQLRDAADHPCRPEAAYAVFELRLRVPRRDVIDYRDLPTESIRWSQKLEFPSTGAAEVKLPLRRRLPSFYVDDPDVSNFSARLGLADWSLPTFAPPVVGVLAVRVSVPSVGVFEAIDGVLVDEPLLVDSPWPQR
ncbi:MAG: hypothetical protein ACO1RT_15780 [Planctomycetaceae bacterium]